MLTPFFPLMVYLFKFLMIFFVLHKEFFKREPTFLHNHELVNLKQIII